MSIFSKYLIERTCHETIHSFEPNCAIAALSCFYGPFIRSLQVYASVYLVSTLLRGKKIHYYYTKLPREILRSALFLATNCCFSMGFFCLMTKLFGGISYWGTLLGTFPASFIAIFVERKQRRGVLALYLANLAAETAFKMLVSRNRIKPIRNGEVLLFAFASAIYAFLFRTKSLDSSIQNLIKMLVGSSECPKTDHSLHKNRQSRLVKYYGVMTTVMIDFLNKVNSLMFERTSRHNRSHNIVVDYLRRLEHRFEHFLNSFSQSANCKHRLCNHRYNCFIYPIVGFVQRFVAGYALQGLFRCISSFGFILKKPVRILKILSDPVNRDLGLFLGAYTLLFRLINCALKWITNNNSELHALVSGFFSGFSMLFYKSSSISLYLNFKLFEILWMLGVENGKLPLFKWFDVVLYSISTAFVLWVSVMEPHNLRPGYWRFLIRISDQRFAKINRYILEPFGVKSTTYDQLVLKAIERKSLASHLKAD